MRKNVTVLVVIVLHIGLFSCENKVYDKYMSNNMWIIDSINYMSTSSFADCFKYGNISFFGYKNEVHLPGFERPIDKGNFHFDDKNNYLIFTNLEECYFKDTFAFYSTHIDSITLISNKLKIFAYRAKFINGRAENNFFEKFVNKEVWSSNECEKLRNHLCTN